jgi:hypothetical protein
MIFWSVAIGSISLALIIEASQRLFLFCSIAKKQPQTQVRIAEVCFCFEILAYVNPKAI